MVCNFISYAWTDAWFSNQKYNQNVFAQLKSALENLSVGKNFTVNVFYCFHTLSAHAAIKCFQSHWSTEE